MGNTYISCDLTKFNSSKFKCYTQSGNKKVYEDDGLTKGQSFIIFPIKTTLSTGECEYTMGLTGQLEDNYPWKSWSYSGYPNDAVPGNTYSYTIKGSPMVLSNYKGVTVTGIPSKTWSWDILTTHAIHLSCDLSFSSVGINILLRFNNNQYLGNDTLSVFVEVTSIRPAALIDSIIFRVSKNSISPLKGIIEIKEDPMRRYKAEIKRCNPMSGDNYQVSYN